MVKKDLFKLCRYYKGEDDCPFKEQNKSTLWFYERAWVFDMLKDSDNRSICITEYVRHGLGSFERFDNVPLSLKALLFNRYAKTSNSMTETVEPFKKFYKEYY